MPLTQSLYVPGQLADTSFVIVDVGTGFYVEKSTADAIKFYNGKVDDLSKNLGDLEKVVQGKNENLRIVEEGQSAYTTAHHCHKSLQSFGHLLIQLRDYSVTAKSNGGTYEQFLTRYNFAFADSPRTTNQTAVHPFCRSLSFK